MSLYRSSTRSPLLEWSDIQTKDLISAVDPSPPNTPPPQSFGCWSAWTAGRSSEEAPAPVSPLTRHLNLDVSYTSVPAVALRAPELHWDRTVNFWSLVELIYPTKPKWNRHGKKYIKLQPTLPPVDFPSSLGTKLHPDDHLACFDQLYFSASSKQTSMTEAEAEWWPAWRSAGQHLRFTDALVDITKSYLRRVFHSGPGDIPPYIAVHIRHNDFKSICGDRPVEDCFEPFSTYVKRVKQVQEELLSAQGIAIPDKRVVIFSDDIDPTFWKEVSSEGYVYLNHTDIGTAEMHGKGMWYPLLVDLTAQGLAKGFVGTKMSTLSLVSQKRVEDWNNGVTRLVWWGYPGADNDHQ